MTPANRSLRVWDLPTRLFHWALVLLLIGSFISVNIGGNWMAWHARLGYTALTLVLFRLLWGFVGGRYARFSSFVHRPAKVLAYLRKDPDAPRTVGHNPLGGLSVLALLAAVGFQSGSGLFANDDIAFDGPLVKFISNAASNTLTSLHHLNAKVIIALVVLHVGAILYYRFVRKENLIRPMLTGDKDAPGASASASDGEAARNNNGHQSSRDDLASRLLAAVLLVLCAGLVYLIVNWPAAG